MKSNKIPKPIKLLVENQHRWAGVVAGPPGSGKTTFMQMLTRTTSAVVVTVKDCQESYLEVPEDVVTKRISAILHFTAEGIRPAFDALSSYMSSSLEQLENVLGRFKLDIAEWVQMRLNVLKQWRIDRKIRVPLCLKNSDELERRLVVGVLYVARHLFPAPVLFDDTLAFIVDQRYSDAFYAMMRPYIFSINRYLDSKELLRFNPIIITPGGSGVWAA